MPPSFLLVAAVSAAPINQGTPDDYRRAEQFLPAQIGRHLTRATVSPVWLADGDRFWYRSPGENRGFRLVNPGRATHGPAFDHDRLAAGLAAAKVLMAGRPLPFDSLLQLDPGVSVLVPIAGAAIRCDLETYQCATAGVAPPNTREQVVSPDGRWVAFGRGFDLAVRSTDFRDTLVLTRDGTADRWYGTGVVSPLGRSGLSDPPATVAFWSPDSRRIATYQIDIRGAGLIPLVHGVRTAADLRPRPYAAPYPLPGDSTTATAELVLFELSSGRRIDGPLPPVPVLYYNLFPMTWPDHWWAADSRHFYSVRRARSNRMTEVGEVNAETGTARLIARDENPTFVERFYQRFNPMGPRGEVVWASERDGWRHLYRLDSVTRQLDRQITRGPWVVRELLRVDDQNGLVFFTAGGREPGRDPYLRHLYRVGLDGSRLELLTPEPADHSVSISPSGRYLVDTYETLEQGARSVVRSARDGTVRLELGTTDLSGLTRLGWQPPRAFRATARDGATDIYGVLLLPTTFDSTRRYPLIDNIYAGPQTLATPKTLAPSRYLWEAQALAELGFVVMVVDGMGTPFRSKKFHDVAYQRLGDAGLPDHMAAIRQLAARHSFIDTTRVGIFGISAGGYASARAILKYPDFFKVAVSAAGCHDLRLDKVEWAERYMGPMGPHYAEQANPTLARNLKGKLLLSHGDLDENVPIAQTYALVDSLIAQRKSFDLLVLPNRNHDVDADPYMIRSRWDYFVKHLLGVEPPPR